MSNKETKEVKETTTSKEVLIKQLALKESLRLGPIATSFFSDANTKKMILLTYIQLVMIVSKDFKDPIYIPLSNIQSFTLVG